MSYNLHCLSSATVDSAPAVQVNVNVDRYQFDAPEGCQRTIVQGKARLRNLNTVFLTSTRPEDTGGLSGMIFSLADRGTTQLTVVGPENTGALVASFRHFLMRDQMDIRVIERSMAPEFNDTKPIFGTDAVQVWAIAAVPSSPTDAASPAPELEAAPLTPAQDAPAAVAAVEAADQPPADDADADAGSATSSEKKRKRSPSPPRTLAPTEFAPVEPTPTAATHPYRRRSATHSANVTRLLLNGMFKSVELAAIRPAHLPLIGAGPRPTHSPYDVMPALARPANDVFLSYVLVGPEKRGKVDTDKSDALGVPRGRLGMLTAGQNVLVTDPQTGAEVTITPDQIMGPSTKPTATVVVHCPTADYIDSLVQAPLWERLFGSDGDAVRPVHVMWHKAGVWEDERYRSWMAKFGPDVVHLSGDPALANDHLNMLSAAVATTSLSIIDPAIYKRFHCGRAPAHAPSAGNVYPILPLQKVSFMPLPRGKPRIEPMHFSGGFPNALDEGIEQIAQLGDEELWRRFDTTLPAYAAEVRKAHEAVRKAGVERGDVKAPGDDVVVTTLGTGSSMPSKYRNVSATHLDIPGHGGVLLDAGEGTLGQLARLYGPQGIVELMQNLKVIFISHLHADHHSGLTNVLRFRTKHTLADNQVTLIGSQRLLTQLREMADFTDVGLDRLRFIDNWDVMQPPKPGSRPSASVGDNLAWVEQATGITQFDAVSVNHRGNSCFGSVIGHRDGWKVVYSGDTKPCDRLVNAGKDATLLIHEATLADDTPESLAALERDKEFARKKSKAVPKSCLELARDKGHSTFSQAVNIGRRMRAKHTLLTHFSQRYPKNPKSTSAPLDADVSDADRAFAAGQVVALASDFVQVRIGDLWKMPLHTDAIAALFEENDEDDSDDGSDSGASQKGKGKGAGAGGKNGGAKGNGQGEPGRKAAKKAAARSHDSAANGRPADRGRSPTADGARSPKPKRAKQELRGPAQGAARARPEQKTAAKG